MSDPPLPRRPGHRRDWLVGLGVFAAGTAVSVLAFTGLEARARRAARADFEREARRLATGLALAIEGPLEVVRSLVALHETVGEVDEGRFRAFVDDALVRYPGIAALEWIPRVTAAAREPLERSARRRGLAGFAVREPGPDGALRPAAPRDEYFPILYMEPTAAAALGFDLAAEPRRRELVERARTSGRLVASGRIRLVEDADDVYSVFVLAPAYAPGTLARTPADRRVALVGLAGAVFRLRPLFDGLLLELGAETLELRVLDALAPQDEQLLYANTLPAATPTAVAPTAVAPEPATSWAAPALHELAFGDRRWRFELASPSLAAVAVDEGPLGALGAGLIASGLAGLGVALTLRVRRLGEAVEASRRIGAYTLGEKLGAGAMGVVYRAQHALLRRPTAVKLLAPDAVSEKKLKRFEREARVTSRLMHPNTIVLYDFGRTADGAFYYAMELVDGVDLETLVETDGPQPAGRVVHLLAQAAGALAEAHAAGLIHRDVKPSNLMLSERAGIADFVTVLDFGLAKDVAADGQLTATGAVVGTPLYLPAEAFVTPDTIDARADLYALGAVGYFLLTGRPPFPAQTAHDVHVQQRQGPPNAPSRARGATLPTDLEALVMRCLSRDPRERPQSASELGEALEACRAAAPWTTVEAREWWQRRGPQLLRPSAAGPPGLETRSLEIRRRPLA